MNIKEDYTLLKEIPTFETWKSVTKIKKGLSKKDIKYIVTMDNTVFLLRISRRPLKKSINNFKWLSKIESQHAKSPEPIMMGILSNGNNYILLSYIPGKDLRKEIQAFNNDTKYELGLKAGYYLKDLHQITQKFNKDYYKYILKKILRYKDYISKNPHRIFDNMDIYIKYLLDNLHIIKSKTLSLTHQDFQIKNFIVDDDLNLGVIDFEHLDFSLAYSEFYRLNNLSTEYETFLDGLIKGYFNDKIPNDFFEQLSFFSVLHILRKRIIFFKEIDNKTDAEIAYILDKFHLTLKVYNDINIIIPSIYEKYYQQNMSKSKMNIGNEKFKNLQTIEMEKRQPSTEIDVYSDMFNKYILHYNKLKMNNVSSLELGKVYTHCFLWYYSQNFKFRKGFSIGKKFLKDEYKNVILTQEQKDSISRFKRNISMKSRFKKMIKTLRGN